MALLRQIGIEPARIEAPDIDETPIFGELARDHAGRLALAKTLQVAGRPADTDAYVLGADTVVACGRRILPKTGTAIEALACLRLLSGRRHRVYTGVCVHAPDGRRAARVALTAVRFKRLDKAEMQTYLDSGEWQGKAGGYAIQGRAEALILAINGSYSNVVGLPLGITMALLTGMGWRPS